MFGGLAITDSSALESDGSFFSGTTVDEDFVRGDIALRGVCADDWNVRICVGGYNVEERERESEGRKEREIDIE